MRTRLILFSGIVMALVGTVLGLAVSKMHQQKYQCCDGVTRLDDPGFNRSRAPGRYATAGAVMGFVIGSAIEGIRQVSPEEQEQ
ncbi:MAG: hypothetical protein ACFBSC_20500 [Microcoleaceae cyanobacterium]